MMQILALHASILGELKSTIFESFNIQPSSIKLADISETDGSILTFQLNCLYSFSNPVKEIFLNFELREISPHTLYFDTRAGIKGYEKTNHYHGLKNEIVKFISTQIND